MAGAADPELHSNLRILRRSKVETSVETFEVFLSACAHAALCTDLQTRPARAHTHAPTTSPFPPKLSPTTCPREKGHCGEEITSPKAAEVETHGAACETSHLLVIFVVAMENKAAVPASTTPERRGAGQARPFRLKRRGWLFRVENATNHGKPWSKGRHDRVYLAGKRLLA